VNRLTAPLLRLLAIAGVLAAMMLGTNAVASAAAPNLAGQPSVSLASYSTPLHISSGPALPDGGPTHTALPGNSYNSVCTPDSGQDASNSTLLSINRWGNVADSFHDRLDGSMFGDIFQKIQRRALFSTMLSAGNSMWQLSSSLTGFATHFCLIDAVGAQADTLASGLGDAALNSGIVALLLAAGQSWCCGAVLAGPAVAATAGRR